MDPSILSGHLDLMSPPPRRRVQIGEDVGHFEETVHHGSVPQGGVQRGRKHVLDDADVLYTPQSAVSISSQSARVSESQSECHNDTYIR